MNLDNSLQPRLLVDVEVIRPVLKRIRAGKPQKELSTDVTTQDAGSTLDVLVDAGLVDHLSFVAVAANQARPGAYFLTDKGLRWLRTYDWWERAKYRMSKWQLVGGIVLGVFINMISSAMWPYVSQLIN
ncbi:hypothetical protein [uncultured Ruegeria sp.]|uniref:hypothetical protein n=1 Tax=uncultured Ruegeria sp. TaxID=259304 RepID=UPI00262BC310|nr:hypothetical protein [uncultured Ruegeria sp.]